VVFELGAISSHRPHNVLVFLRLFFLIINIYNNVLLALLYIHFLLLRTIRIQTLLRETQNDWFIFFIDMTMSLKIVMWNLDLFFPLFLFFSVKYRDFVDLRWNFVCFDLNTNTYHTILFLPTKCIIKLSMAFKREF